MALQKRRLFQAAFSFSGLLVCVPEIWRQLLDFIGLAGCQQFF
ncbi:hypothetical protein [Pseudomonas alloputida]